MQLSNYHSHCNFCDGRSYPEDFVRFAVARGFRAYGFSSHSPLPFETFWNMSRDDMDEYLAEIARLKAKYEGQIELYVGLEVDFLDRTYNASIPYFKNLPLDYRIGSIHFLPLSPVLEERNMACIDGAYSEFARTVDAFFEGDIRRMVRRYFEAEMEMVEHPLDHDPLEPQEQGADEEEGQGGYYVREEYRRLVRPYEAGHKSYHVQRCRTDQRGGHDPLEVDE